MLSAAVTVTEEADPPLTDTSYDYQWYRGETEIEGATSKDYTAAAADIGQTLKVSATVKSDNAKYTGTATSQPTQAVEDTALYRMDVSDATTMDGKIVSYKLVDGDVSQASSVTPEEVSLADVADFGTATTKTSACTALDGWGYKHWVLASDFTTGRQSYVEVDKSTNTVQLHNPGNDSANGVLSFLPSQKDITLPEDKVYIYAFEIVGKTTRDASCTYHYGVTTSASGSTLTSAKETDFTAVNTAEVATPVGIIVNPTEKTCKFVIDGKLEESLTYDYTSSDAPTGIYIRGNGNGGSAKDGYIGIRNLVVASADATTQVAINYLSKGADSNTAINDAEGKTASTVDWVAGAPFTTSAKMKENFDNTGKTLRYMYNADESIAAIEAVSDTNKTINLVFDPVEYKETSIKVTLPAAAEAEGVTVPVIVNGTPDDPTAAKVDNQTVSIQIENTQTEGTGTINLLPGTYTYSVEESEYNLPKTGDIKSGEDCTILLEENPDPKYAVTINTAPFATVVLDAGQSTKETVVPTQTTKADATGTAVFTDRIPAGSYTVDITTTNKYLDSKQDASITVAKGATSIDVALDFKATYENMIYGQDFSDADNALNVNTTPLKGWTGANVADARINNGTTYAPGFSNTTNVQSLSGGNHLFIYTYNQSDSTYKLTTDENITKIKFDAFYGNMCNDGDSARHNRTNAEVKLQLGGTNLNDIGTYAYNGGTSTLTVGTKKAQKSESDVNVYDKWLNYEITISGKKATVTVKDGADTVISAEQVDLTDEDADIKSFNITTVQQWGAIAIDNLEVYGAGE